MKKASGEKLLRCTGAFFHSSISWRRSKPQNPRSLFGVGVASWSIPFGSSTVTFEYPLLTQALEISLDERTMALEVRPRSTDTKVEMDAFAACSVNGAAGVEVSP